jgi:dihydroxyacetone kinase-like protein
MRKIAEADFGRPWMRRSGSIKAMLDDAAAAVMCLNGGSAVPLWNSWLDGLQEAAPDAGEN